MNLDPLARVFVLTADPECPAHWALAQEGVEHEVLINQGELGYGRNFAALWDRGRMFVAIEHDCVPWPGAVEMLLECVHPRCSHPVAVQPGHIGMGFNNTKIMPNGKAPAEWCETKWDALDGLVVPVMNERLGRVHVHEPPFAHARKEAVR